MCHSPMKQKTVTFLICLPKKYYKLEQRIIFFTKLQIIFLHPKKYSQLCYKVNSQSSDYTVSLFCPYSVFTREHSYKLFKALFWCKC